VRKLSIGLLFWAGLNMASSGTHARQEQSSVDLFVNEKIRSVEEFDGCTGGGLPNAAFESIEALGVRALPALIENITSDQGAAGDLKELEGSVSIIANCLIYRIAYEYLDDDRIGEIKDRHYGMGHYGKNRVLVGIIPSMKLRRKLQREIARQLTEKNVVRCELRGTVSCIVAR